MGLLLKNWGKNLSRSLVNGEKENNIVNIQLASK